MVKFAVLRAAACRQADAGKTKSKLANCSALCRCHAGAIFQSSCNAIHSIEQRTAKWVISAMERPTIPETVPLTHEQLATLLGVGDYTSR